MGRIMWMKIIMYRRKKCVLYKSEWIDNVGVYWIVTNMMKVIISVIWFLYEDYSICVIYVLKSEMGI